MEFLGDRERNLELAHKINPNYDLKIGPTRTFPAISLSSFPNLIWYSCHTPKLQEHHFQELDVWKLGILLVNWARQFR